MPILPTFDGDSMMLSLFSPFLTLPIAGEILNYAEPAWQVLPSQAYRKANKLLAIFISFCRLAYPEVADRKAQDGQRSRLATAAFCRKFCPGLAPFMQCFREGNVNEFRRLQQRHENSLWRLGLTVGISFPNGTFPLLFSALCMSRVRCCYAHFLRSDSSCFFRDSCDQASGHQLYCGAP